MLAPKDGNELEGMFDYALNLKGPVAIRYPRGASYYDKNITSTYQGGNYRLIKSENQTVDIWACGKMVSWGEKVCDILKETGRQRRSRQRIAGQTSGSEPSRRSEQTGEADCHH